MIMIMQRSNGNKEARAAAAKADQDTISSFLQESDTDEEMSE